VRRPLPWLVGGLGTVLLVGGIVIFALADSAGFGWTAYTAAYAPLQPGEEPTQLNVTFADGSVLWSGQHALGAALAVLGLLVLVGLGGWILGGRSARRQA
jgi:prepilin-type processing-associated H-X9-DG protein